MALPLNTTEISIRRTVETTDWYDGYDADPPSPQVIATGVRAVISPPSGSARLIGGDRIVYNSQLRCDPCDLQAQDTVTDAAGNDWTVLTVSTLDTFGFSFMSADVRMVTGAAP